MNGLSLPTDRWQFMGLVAILAVQLFSAWQNRQISAKQDTTNHQLNSLTDARVLSASQTGHAEGMIAGAAGEQDRVAKMIAAQVAIEVAKRLEEEGRPAIQVKPVGGKP
jgi:hypothetical protein